jgi:hypothetical protein
MDMRLETKFKRNPKYISSKGLVSNKPRGSKAGGGSLTNRSAGQPWGLSEALTNVIVYAPQRGAGKLYKTMKSSGGILAYNGHAEVGLNGNSTALGRLSGLGHRSNIRRRMDSKSRIIDSKINGFLSAPVPPWPSREADAWNELAKKLGGSWPERFLQALQSNSTSNGQYVALLVLRRIGYTAWAEGYGKDLFYRVTSPEGLAVDIKPVQVQEDS